MKIQLTGRLRLEGDRGLVEATDFPGRQGRIAFASLLVASHAVDRAALADRIWGENLPLNWERHLSAVVSKLRTLIESVDDVPPGVITALSGAYELHLPNGAEVDLRRAGDGVHVMEQCLRTGEELPAGTMDPTLEILARPFLPGEAGAWVESVRLDMRALYVRALDAAAEIHGRAGNPAAAVELARQAVELEPFRETGYRRLMRLQLELGDRAEAVRTYEHCRGLLADELGVDPAPETHHLYISALRARRSAPELSAAGNLEVTDAPPTHYTRNRDVHLAYQVFGKGSIDVLAIGGWVYPME